MEFSDIACSKEDQSDSKLLRLKSTRFVFLVDRNIDVMCTVRIWSDSCDNSILIDCRNALGTK